MNYLNQFIELVSDGELCVWGIHSGVNMLNHKQEHKAQ